MHRRIGDVPAVFGNAALLTLESDEFRPLAVPVPPFAIRKIGNFGPWRQAVGVVDRNYVDFFGAPGRFDSIDLPIAKAWATAEEDDCPAFPDSVDDAKSVDGESVAAG
jgi:hypothetical protein